MPTCIQRSQEMNRAVDTVEHRAGEVLTGRGLDVSVAKHVANGRIRRIQLIGLLQIIRRLIAMAERIKQIQTEFLADIEVEFVSLGRLAVNLQRCIGITAPICSR